MGFAFPEVRRIAGKSVLSAGRQGRWPAGVYAYGFSLNKRSSLRRFVSPSVVRFVRSAAGIAAGSTLMLWGSRAAPAGLALNVAVVRVEDGFLRSVGLGAEFARPLSWVMDARGIHYDATRTSDLERLLQTGEFPAALLARADVLRRRLAACGITKYSVGTGTWRRPDGAAHVILVPGQVESDASLRLGAPGLRGNMELLRAVRLANPDSYVIFKPHPDVGAGLRMRGAGEEGARAFCDEVAADVAMGGMLNRVDEVHVLTSLAGFEALLRERTVVCYGLPFYAGWGLTRDMLAIPRRTRRLSLEQLVAGSLIAYPAYIGRSDGAPTTPERVLDDLIEWRGTANTRVPPWRRLWRGAIRAAVGAA